MQFEAFFEAVNGTEPFPWQKRLAHIVAAGRPPEALDVPTGSGKTALIDVWIWALLFGHPVPRRLFFVIDRRIVVDEVADRGQRIVEAVRAKGLGTLERLPYVQTLRGGQAADHTWMLNPVRPALISTTVDQFGSRLLFRGYGVTASSAPIHAALTGIDAWIAVDEAHLSQPLCQTLRRVRQVRKPGSLETQLPWWITELTATPVTSSEAVTLQDDDLAHVVLAARFGSAKPARLASASGNEIEGVLAREALRLRKSGAAVVAVVVNQVALARAVFENLSRCGEAVLLTGRQRPFDRADTVDALLPRILAAYSSRPREPLFVVATQTIEVGLDADFDGLVTQVAPLPALRQRFGRLNRTGRLSSAPAVIVVGAGTDPVYGEATNNCVKWLKANATDQTIDFGINAMRKLCAEQPPPAPTPTRAPRLSNAQIGLLSHTWPAPDIDVAPYLHGLQRETDVRLAWRADLVEVDADRWAEIVDAAPLQVGELMTVPAGAVRAWLQGEQAGISDLGAQPEPEPRRDRHELPAARQALRVDLDEPTVIDGNQLRAGMTIVVPASYGGSDRFGWAPERKAPVADLGDCGADRMRLHPALLGSATAGALSALDQIDRPSAADAVALLGLDDQWKRARLIRYAAGYLLEPRTRSSRDTRTQRAIGLVSHQTGVGARAAGYARVLGLSTAMQALFEVAGHKHDAGKADPRYQIVLGGSPLAPLAKGAVVAFGGAARRRYAEAGLDPGWRHEIASLIHANLADPLLRHLVGSHHGRGRPWLPAAPDELIYRDVNGDDWPRQFSCLQREHGLWGLAYLESLLRLADWEQSAAEQEGAWSD